MRRPAKACRSYVGSFSGFSRGIRLLALVTFVNRFADDRSDQGPPGAHMALFAVAWSVAHIIGHALVSNPMAQLGRTTTW